MRTVWLALTFAVLLGACHNSGWTAQEKAEFAELCQRGAAMEGDAYPAQTCACLAEKLEKQFPDPADIETEFASSRQLMDSARACRITQNETAVDWTPQAEQAFLSSCKTLHQTGRVKDSADCPCILAKVKARYPTIQKLQQVDAARMGALADECAGERQLR